jgi:hypothetical protein
MSGEEIKHVRVKKLLRLASMTNVHGESLVRPEVFVQNALTIDPGNPVVLAALKDASGGKDVCPEITTPQYGFKEKCKHLVVSQVKKLRAKLNG